jgi:hypothetical protein
MPPCRPPALWCALTCGCQSPPDSWQSSHQRWCRVGSVLSRLPYLTSMLSAACPRTGPENRTAACCRWRLPRPASDREGGCSNGAHRIFLAEQEHGQYTRLLVPLYTFCHLKSTLWGSGAPQGCPGVQAAGRAVGKAAQPCATPRRGAPVANATTRDGEARQPNRTVLGEHGPGQAADGLSLPGRKRALRPGPHSLRPAR